MKPKVFLATMVLGMATSTSVMAAQAATLTRGGACDA